MDDKGIESNGRGDTLDGVLWEGLSDGDTPAETRIN